MASSLAALLHPQITGIPNGVGVSAAELPYAAGAPVANTVASPLTNDLFTAMYQRGPYAGLRGVLKGTGEPLGLPAAGQSTVNVTANPGLARQLEAVANQAESMPGGGVQGIGRAPLFEELFGHVPQVGNPTINGTSLFTEGSVPMQGAMATAMPAAGTSAVHPVTQALSSQVEALSSPVTPGVGSIPGVGTPPVVGPYSTFPGAAGDIPNMVTSAAPVVGEYSAFPAAASAAIPGAEAAAESAAPGLASRLLPTLSAARAGEATGLLGRVAGGGRLVRGAGGVAAGIGLHAAGTALGGSGSNGTLAGQLVGGASTGAGIGGGIAGLPGGIVGGLGTGIANVATHGGFEDMVNDWIGKGPADKFKADTDPNVYAIMGSLNDPNSNTFSQLGISDDKAQEIKDKFHDAITDDNGHVTTDQNVRVDALKSAAEQAFRASQTAATDTTANTAPSMSPTDIAALQIMASQLFAPIAADQQQIGAMQGAALHQLAPSLPGPYQDVIGHMAQTARTNGNRSANALIQQAYAIPQVNALDQYQQYLNQASGQLVSSALGGQLTGGSGSGLTGLLGNLGAASGAGATGDGSVNPDSAALIAQITGQ